MAPTTTVAYYERVLFVSEFGYTRKRGLFVHNKFCCAIYHNSIYL